MLTSETLVMIAGVVLSLAFEYLPGVKDWYEARPETHKRLIMAGLVTAVALVVLALSCTNSPYQLAECSVNGAWSLLGLVITALVANQTTHLLFKKPNDVQ